MCLACDARRFERHASDGLVRFRCLDEFEELEHPAAQKPERLLELDEALTKLEAEDPQKAQLVKLRFFAGLTNKQAALALGISPATADRYWAFARAWLKTEMDH